MKQAMKTYAEKLMKRTHKAVMIYQQELAKKQELPLAQRNMLYGNYLLDINDAL